MPISLGIHEMHFALREKTERPAEELLRALDSRAGKWEGSGRSAEHRQQPVGRQERVSGLRACLAKLTAAGSAKRVMLRGPARPRTCPPTAPGSGSRLGVAHRAARGSRGGPPPARRNASGHPTGDEVAEFVDEHGQKAPENEFADPHDRCASHLACVAEPGGDTRRERTIDVARRRGSRSLPTRSLGFPPAWDVATSRVPEVSQAAHHFTQSGARVPGRAGDRRDHNIPGAGRCAELEVRAHRTEHLLLFGRHRPGLCHGFLAELLGPVRRGATRSAITATETHAPKPSGNRRTPTRKGEVACSNMPNNP